MIMGTTNNTNSSKLIYSYIRMILYSSLPHIATYTNIVASYILISLWIDNSRINGYKSEFSRSKRKRTIIAMVCVDEKNIWYGGAWLPRWIANNYLNNILGGRLYSCRNLLYQYTLSLIVYKNTNSKQRFHINLHLAVLRAIEADIHNLIIIA